ncbi:MAG: hypothetical protein KA362_09605 [Chloroflexi bacterium]|nr:hypothetical protein [Chloroflexota bacterium]MBK7177184.1 hypothetical protein [Chloroflexota bacterium]MBP6804354.1 hypothetical protein [Chloroflexota bacterium]MBP7592438.1 hypothetical protein [Chloroflexota bacterium]
MQGIKLESWKIEIAIPNFLVRAALTPRGDLMIFLNNLTYTSFNFNDVEMMPLGTDFQVKGVKQSMINISRSAISYISVLEPHKAAQIQLLQSKRAIVFYTEWFAVRGDLHVNSETPNENLLDDKFHFFMLTDATIFPLRTMTARPIQKVPAVAFNRLEILAYHPQS